MNIIDTPDRPLDPPEEAPGEPEFDKDIHRDYTLVDELKAITLTQRMDSRDVTLDKLMQTLGKRQAE